MRCKDSLGDAVSNGMSRRCVESAGDLMLRSSEVCCRRSEDAATAGAAQPVSGYVTLSVVAPI